MFYRLFIFLFFLLIHFNCFSQTKDTVRKPDYLSFQTGLMYDGYNSLGIRTYFEYQKDLKKNWQFGIAYEHTIHFGYGITDQHNQLPTSLNIISFNGYYKLQLAKDRFFWTAGLGAGFVQIDWDNSNKFGVVFNLSMTLNIRLSKKVYLETSPLFYLLPVNRVYFSALDIPNYNNFVSCTIFPIGIKVKL